MSAPYLMPIIALGIVAVVVVVGIFVAGSSNNASSAALPAMPKTGQPVPESMAGITSGTPQQASATLSQLAQAGAANFSQFKASYSGSISIVPSGILGAIESVNSPLYLNEYGTGASERMDINASSMPVVGRALVTYLNTTRNTYVCDNLNASAMSQGKVLDILTGSRELTCSSNDTLLAPRLRGLYNLNLSMLSQFGIAISYDQVYQSEYNGSPCTYVHGMLSGLNGSGELGMCILDSNYIPATIAARFSNSNAHLFLVLNETYIGNGTAFPGSLPGPLT